MIKSKEIARLYRITKTIIEYGLIELIPHNNSPFLYYFMRLCLFWIHRKHKNKEIAIRLRLALESLGPIYIKLGQMLSTRRDLLSQEFSDQLTYFYKMMCSRFVVK